MADDVRPTVQRSSGVPTLAALLRLPRDAQAPALARQLVRRLCADAAVADGVSETVVLLTSETVTNSVLHGRGRVQLRASSGSGCIRVEVADGSRRAPVTAPVGAQEESGRGVRLMQQCASSWGVDVRRRGKTVWFEVATA